MIISVDANFSVERVINCMMHKPKTAKSITEQQMNSKWFRWNQSCHVYSTAINHLLPRVSAMVF